MAGCGETAGKPTCHGQYDIDINKDEYLWHTILDDKGADSRTFYLPICCKNTGIDTKQLLADAMTPPWDDTHNIPRSICRLTQSGCSCPYKYGKKIHSVANDFLAG